MNILILTMSIGGNAPGLVFESLIEGLSNFHQIDVITAKKENKTSLDNINDILVLPYRDIHPRLKKVLIGLFSINPLDYFWGRKCLRLYRKRKKRYDLVFSLISFHSYAALLAGNYIAYENNTKFSIYSVDAIPAPGWPEKWYYFEGVKRLVKKYLKNCDYFFSANSKMLKYQLSLFENNPKLKSGVIYNPANISEKVYPFSTERIFLYTGGVYGVRRVSYLFNALKIVLKKYPDVKLNFVGTRISKKDMDILTEKEKDAVIINAYTKDLSPYYRKAIALIDIDADIENDVFLSSKMTNYIMLNRPIICETGENSPSRAIFKNIPSILQCNHDPNEIAKAMMFIIENPITDYSDRNECRKQFEKSYIVENLNNSYFNQE